MAKKIKIIDRYLLAEVLKIYYIKDTKVDQAKMSNAIIALVNIVDIFTTPMKGGL
jgi:hypothetical protein